MAFEYEKYLRMDKIPHLWCPGCGIGIVLKAILRAADRMGWDNDDIAFVSGIGCTSRAPGYVDVNTLHTTHGRALTFATGIKMAQPKKHIIVIGGDGDSTAIGGNHFIHACRRDIDITMVIVNNHIYGMTGGQHSPTTPIGTFASTTSYGNIDPSFDISRLASAAGASYVARSHVKKGKVLENYIFKAMSNKGFSVVEALSNCHTQFGRRNKMADPVVAVQWIADNEVTLPKAKKMTAEELEGKFITGEYVTPNDDFSTWEYYNRSKTEYTEAYENLKKTALKKK